MLPTPSTSHVSYDLIYEPAEDSYLFLDTLSSATEAAWLRERFPTPRSTGTSNSRIRTKTKVDGVPPLLVEIGPGSGVVVAFLTAHARTIFGRDVVSLSVDVNPYACRAARMTVEKALEETKAATATSGRRKDEGTDVAGESRDGQSVYLASLQGDLATPLRPSEVDVLVFNPPYVPTESVPLAPTVNTDTDTNTTTASTTSAPAAPTASPPPPLPSSSGRPTFAEQSHLLALSYAGGLDGMEVTNRLLRQIPEILSPRGVAYVLFCRGNRPDEVKRWIRSWSSPEQVQVQEQQQRQRQHHSEGADEQGQGQGQYRWRAETVGSSGKTAGWEKLEIVRIWRE